MRYLANLALVLVLSAAPAAGEEAHSSIAVVVEVGASCSAVSHTKPHARNVPQVSVNCTGDLPFVATLRPEVAPDTRKMATPRESATDGGGHGPGAGRTVRRLELGTAIRDTVVTINF